MKNDDYKRLARAEAMANSQRAELMETLKRGYEKACEENGERHELRYLRAEPDSNIPEAIHNFASSGGDFAVFHPLTNSRLCYVVAYAREIMMYVAFQHPPLGAVVRVISPEVRCNAVEGVIDASPAQTSAIISDKGFCHFFV